MPKIVDREQKQSQIAKAAIALFAEKGFENTSIKDIALKTGIGKGTLYHYFESKDAILYRASLEILTEFEKSMSDSFLKKRHPSDKLRVLMQEAMSITEEVEQIFFVYMELWLIHLRENQYGRFMDIFRELLQGFRIVVRDIIEEGKQKKLYRQDVDPKNLAIYLVASIDGIYLHYYFDQQAFDLLQICSEFMENFIAGLEVAKEG